MSLVLALFGARCAAFQTLTTPRSPWQNPFAERVIGTIRRQLLDHMIVLSEGHLRRRFAQLFSATTTARGRISRSRRMRPSRAPSSDLSTAVWSPYPTSAASTTAIPPSGVVLILPPPAARRSAISARDGFAASGTDYGRSRSTPWPAARRPSACSTTRCDRRGLDRRDRVLANDGVLHVRRTHRGLVNVGSVVHHCVPELAVVDC